jgi:hypothetical protein
MQKLPLLILNDGVCLLCSIWLSPSAVFKLHHIYKFSTASSQLHPRAKDGWIAVTSISQHLSAHGSEEGLFNCFWGHCRMSRAAQLMSWGLGKLNNSVKSSAASWMWMMASYCKSLQEKDAMWTGHFLLRNYFSSVPLNNEV